MPRFALLVTFAALLAANLAASELALIAAYRRPTIVPAPADNATTPARVALGKMLFFDPRLSGNQAISCATCHNPSFQWTDRLPLGRGDGHQQLARRTPTIINAAFNELQMWDGRFSSLEEQAAGPMMSAAEMNIDPEKAARRLEQIPRYVELFREAYGDAGINTGTITKAIAAYERTIVSSEAPFDRFVQGDHDAISEAAKRGFALFNTKANCAACHSGWNFTDSSFHDIGVASSDPGRGKTLGIESMNHTFKTPTLRNVAQRAPYTHNGSETTLLEIIELYDQGGRVKRPTLSSEIKPLHLTREEKLELVAFLETLTSEDPPVSLPVLP